MRAEGHRPAQPLLASLTSPVKWNHNAACVDDLRSTWICAWHVCGRPAVSSPRLRLFRASHPGLRAVLREGCRHLTHQPGMDPPPLAVSHL